MRSPALVLFSLIFVTAVPSFGVGRERGGQKIVNDMSIEELRQEARRLSRDDVPYVKYIRASLAAAEEAWPKLKDAEQPAFKARVYWTLVDAARLLSGDFVLPEVFRDQPFDAKYSGAMELGSVLEILKLEDQRVALYKEFFASESFQKSPSTYRDAVVDLWQRYEKAGQAVPFASLVSLNQPGRGRPGDSVPWMHQLAVGKMYSDLGEHATAAAWYAKVPPEGLGLLKAADEWFAARRFVEAAESYNNVLIQLNDWAARQPRLHDSAIAEPLERANLQDVRKHVEARLEEIKRLTAKS